MDGALAIETRREGALTRDLPLGLAGSGLLHAGLVAALFLLTPMRNFVVPEPPPIIVELIPPDAVAPPEEPSPAAPIEPAAPTAPVASDGTTTPTQTDAVASKPIEAKTLYAADLLKSPQMAKVRQTLPTLAGSERIIQLCNIEGLQQIRHAAPAYAPDTLVPYAMEDMGGSRFTLIARGGAFRSRRKWYRVAFSCDVAPDYSGVTAFSFTLGSAIPEADWDAHSLTVEDADE